MPRAQYSVIKTGRHGFPTLPATIARVHMTGFLFLSTSLLLCSCTGATREGVDRLMNLIYHPDMIRHISSSSTLSLSGSVSQIRLHIRIRHDSTSAWSDDVELVRTCDDCGATSYHLEESTGTQPTPTLCTKTVHSDHVSSRFLQLNRT